MCGIDRNSNILETMNMLSVSQNGNNGNSMPVVVVLQKINYGNGNGVANMVVIMVNEHCIDDVDGGFSDMSETEVEAAKEIPIKI